MLCRRSSARMGLAGSGDWQKSISSPFVSQVRDMGKAFFDSGVRVTTAIVVRSVMTAKSSVTVEPAPASVCLAKPVDNRKNYHQQ
jgi:hypothetical protein